MQNEEATSFQKGPDVSRKLFGGVLEFDAAGHYPGLELLNFVFCSEEEEPLPNTDYVKIRRRSHDFGRRLVWDDEFQEDPRRHEVLLQDEHAEQTLRELLRCLQLEIPSGTKEPNWARAHFFPYTHALIHWDAREGRKEWDPQLRKYVKTTKIERRYLRGGGALAFKILRSDQNSDRLTRIRDGFESLYAPTLHSPLESLSKFINDQSTKEEQPEIDLIEKKTRIDIDHFEDVFRDGICNILEQQLSTSVSKVRAIMGWTGLWLVLMQHRRAARSLENSESPLICDCAGRNPQLRRISQRCLQDVQSNILKAVLNVNPRLPKAQRNKIKSFFWATAAANGFLNAWRGRKHFTLSVDALELIAMATIPNGTQTPYERFVSDILFNKLGIVVGREAAEASNLIGSIDASIFEENEAQLALQMIAAGLVTQYSDATKMVSPATAAF